MNQSSENLVQHKILYNYRDVTTSINYKNRYLLSSFETFIKVYLRDQTKARIDCQKMVVFILAEPETTRHHLQSSPLSSF